jgi:hypothetical protein
MKNFESLNAWAISALHQFGFHKVLKTVNAEMIVNKPLLNQELGQKSEWGGFYHLFQHGSSIGLYMFNQIENKVQVITVDSEIDLKDLLQTKKTRTPEEILKESRQDALSEQRLIDEKKKVEEFIAKNIEINGVKDLDNINIVERSLISESELAIFYSLKDLGNAYTVALDSNVIIFGNKVTLKKGQVLLPLRNKIHELVAVLTLGENGHVLESFVVSPRPQTVNCYTLGDINIENSKWVFIAKDLISALIIKSETDVNVLVCEDERSINDLIVDLRNRFKSLKIGQFLDGKLTINQTISIHKQDMLGVYYFNIAPDFQGEPKWSSFIVDQSSSTDFSLQALIKKEVKAQVNRVNKLQTNWD